MGLDLKQLILIFLIVLLLFGGKKLPALARSIGQGISEFKKGIAGAGDSQVETSEVYRSPADEDTQENTEEKDITPPRQAIAKPAPKKISAPAKKTTVKKASASKKPAQKTAAKKTAGRGKKA